MDGNSQIIHEKKKDFFLGNFLLSYPVACGSLSHPKEKAGASNTCPSSHEKLRLRWERSRSLSLETVSLWPRRPGASRTKPVVRTSHMAKNNRIHVVPRDGQWAWRREGSERVSGIVPTQREAIDRARPVSQREGGELFIHRPNGQIRDRDSHGDDPRTSKG
jgi:hypothetical protein